MVKSLAMTLALTAATVGVADAGSTNTTFVVSATLLSACSTSATPLAFTAYTPGIGAVANNSTISVKCTKNTAYTVALNAGTAGTFTQRLMSNGTNRLQYNLYTSATFGTVFGDGTGGTAMSPGTGLGLGTANMLTVFGQVPDSAVNQVAVPGSYSDTITVTVSY